MSKVPVCYGLPDWPQVLSVLSSAGIQVVFTNPGKQDVMLHYDSDIQIYIVFYKKVYLQNIRDIREE